MEVGQVYRVVIDDFDINGYGVARIENKVVFVIGALKDETVECKITNIHKKYAFSECVRIIKKSPNRIESPCPYSKWCGGCDMLHMTYETECRIKENRLKQTFRNFTEVSYNPIISNRKEFGYRNKVMVPFQLDEEGDIVYGFYEKNSHKVVPMNKCLISNDKCNDIVYFVARYLNIFHISIYDEEKHKGVFRELMLRYTSLDEYMVVLVATEEYDFSVLVKYLLEEFPCIKSIYLNINPAKTNVVLSDKFKLLSGNPVIIERILGLDFQVSPSSFLQVNHDQCERLYQEAIRMANLGPDMNVIDAYCGMGSITLNIAKYVKKVYGIEIVPSAIKNAIQNKKMNGITNAEFICGKCEEEIVHLVNKEKMDVVFFDPPRKGCDERFLETIVSMMIPKIVYISCNVATCARDVRYLEEHGYKLKEATPVDLFSKTLHVESIVLLGKK